MVGRGDKPTDTLHIPLVEWIYEFTLWESQNGIFFNGHNGISCILVQFVRKWSVIYWTLRCFPILDQYPPAKTPCIDATYFQRSPNKQLKSQCLNSHAHTLRRTFFCPRSPCFPSFVAPQEHTPQCQQKLLLPKKTSSISKIPSITLQWSGFNQSPGFKKKLYSCDLDFSGSCVASHSGGFKKHGILFLISLGFEP